MLIGIVLIGVVLIGVVLIGVVLIGVGGTGTQAGVTVRVPQPVGADA
ncbi:MAG TPA: hypothetical protein VI248_22850 [Kineosporiaceae bacterium]